MKQKKKNIIFIVIICLLVAGLIFLFIKNITPAQQSFSTEQSGATTPTTTVTIPTTQADAVPEGVNEAPETPSSPQQSDNNYDIFNYGTCDDGMAYLHKDVCYDSTTLTEYYVDIDMPNTCKAVTEICWNSYCSNGACVDIGNNVCDDKCNAIRGYDYNGGICKLYNSGGALSQQMKCQQDSGTYESLTGCDRGYICCCYNWEIL